MNERIRELAEQQGLTGPNYLISTQELEKFAELIVRECMFQIERVQRIQTTINPGPEYVEGFNNGMFVAIRTIEEHFGVE